MRAFINIFLLSIPILVSGIFAQEKPKNDINFIPVKHATCVIQTSSTTIYVDPVGDTTAFQRFSKPDIILITDIHGDHLNADVVKSLKRDESIIIGPKAVIDRLIHHSHLVMFTGDSYRYKESTLRNK